MTKVALAKCENYDLVAVKEKIRDCLQYFGGIENLIQPQQKVFIKLNCVGAFPPEMAITTHPVFLEAVIEIVKERTERIIVGDNPATKDLVHTLKKCGLYECIIKNSCQILSGKELMTISNSNPKLYGNFEVSKEMFDVDVLINLPKLKTHSLTYMSVAEKNFFGVIYGLSKAGWHVRANNPLEFGEALNDLYGAILESFEGKRIFHLCDGIIGLEGEGPSSGGSPRQAGAILASNDAVSLDRVAVELCHLNYDKMFVTKIAGGRNYGEADLSKIEICGESLENFQNVKFQEPVNPTSSFGLKILRYRILRNLLLEHPRIDTKLCIRCGECVKICPPKTMKISPHKYPELKPINCIRCWCCAEVCPQNAIKKTRRPLIGQIVFKNREK
ncbi:MAG: DUF362 domain-containing protein [Acholeplasmataceae bacterium]|nr:DUF362 domain-containing protein [Acholeplasmataceae bacterium]